MIPVRNVWYLLLYAWDLSLWKELTHAEVEQSPNLTGLLARILASSCENLLRMQLGQAFLERESLIHGVKGKVNIAASARQSHFLRARTVCRFPEISVDTPKNRIIKATICGLLGDSRLDFGASVESAAMLRAQLAKILRQLAAVGTSRVHVGDFSGLLCGQNERQYRLPLAICKLIALKRMPVGTDGDVLISALLEDELHFSAIFERFVRNFLRLHLEGCSVSSERLKWTDISENALLPIMQTDTTVYFEENSRRRLVIETKYYRDALVRNSTYRDKFRSTHLYQVYAYLRTQEQRGEVFLTSSALVLYPAVNYHLDEQVEIQGHRVRVATIDLSQEWSELEDRLLELVRSS